MAVKIGHRLRCRIGPRPVAWHFPLLERRLPLATFPARRGHRVAASSGPASTRASHGTRWRDRRFRLSSLPFPSPTALTALPLAGTMRNTKPDPGAVCLPLMTAAAPGRFATSHPTQTGPTLLLD